MALVLIIDDDETTRVMLGAAVEALGHPTTFAADGDVGVKLFKEQHYDVVIMDLAMPVKNGMLAIQEILAEYPAANIVAISGVDAVDLDLAQEHGAVRTLQKPITPKQVQDVVEEVLARTAGEGWDDLHTT